MIEYDSHKKLPPFLDELIQLFHYHELIFLITGNILKNRYKRSVLGILWMLLNPLLQTIVLAIAFGAMFKSSLSNYPVYLLSGLLTWNFITQTTQYSMGTMAYGGGLLKKIYIPRATYIIAAVGNGFVNFMISIFSMVIVVLFLGHPIESSWFFLPFSIIIITVFSLGFALLLSTASVFFVDSIDIYQVLIQAFFFLTPIIYPISTLPSYWSGLMAWNPFYYFVEIFRMPIYENTLPGNDLILISSLLATSTLLIGWLIFTSKADQLAYRL
ncbi:MAG: ABC transporter permease [Candidatus Contendobacter sp.]|nr:ABC transporter permease [Candidatus Contendobacter sp.]